MDYLQKKIDKYGLNSIFILLLIAAVLSYSINDEDKSAKVTPVQSYSQMQPRMRVSRSASLTLSTTFQLVDFSGTSTYNINTFGNDPVSGNPYVYWDATNKLFRFYNTTDVNLVSLFVCSTTVSLLTSPATLRYRLVIPNGVSPGVNINVPNPDYDGFADMGAINPTTHRSYAMTLPIYINQAIRTNGFRLEVCISNALLIGTTITLDNASFLIQSSVEIN